MTTLQKVDAEYARFEGKAPRDAYVQVCGELAVRPQDSIRALLCDAPNDWGKHQTLLCSHCVLGTRGCLALLPIIRCSRSLRRLDFRGCGVSDEFVSELEEVLQEHPSIRSVDMGDNPLVTVRGAKVIIKLLRANKNIVTFNVDGTHVGDNVGKIILALCERNHQEVANYYADDFFRMRDLFNYLDADGSGWVHLKNFVLNTPYPVLQARLVERIINRRPRKRSDNTISINTFLDLVYMNFKSEAEIEQRRSEAEDAEYVFIKENWKRLLRALETCEEVVEGPNEAAAPPRADAEAGSPDDGTARAPQAAPDAGAIIWCCEPPEDLHRLRVRDGVLSHDDAEEIVRLALHMQMQLVEDGAPAPSGSEPNRRRVVIPVRTLMQAYRNTITPYAVPKVAYAFLLEDEEDFIPAAMRCGSRMMSISRLSFVTAPESTANGEDGADGTVGGGGGGDTREPPHTWSLPPSMVRQIVEFFNAEVLRLPPKHVSRLPETPRSKRDALLEKRSIPVVAFLSAAFETDLEWLRVKGLYSYFVKYSIPVDESTITLQEMVNCLDEFYVQIRVDKHVTLEDIRSMPSDLTSELANTTTVRADTEQEL